MFGSGRIRELEAQLSELQSKMDSINKKNETLTRDLETERGKSSGLETKLSDLDKKRKADQEKFTQQNETLTQALGTAQGRVSELEAQLKDFDLEQLKTEAQNSKDEYECLKELYVTKRKTFEESMEEIARQTEEERIRMENEIRENRQANQDYVVGSVKTFAESYNYYFGQIKLLMDTLSDVTTQIGEELFSGENGDLKVRIGHRIRERLKTRTDALEGDGDLLLFDCTKNAEPEAPQPEAEETEEMPEA